MKAMQLTSENRRRLHRRAYLGLGLLITMIGMFSNHAVVSAQTVGRWSVQIGTSPNAQTNAAGLPQDTHLAGTGNNTDGWTGGGSINLGILSQDPLQLGGGNHDVTFVLGVFEGGLVGIDGNPLGFLGFDSNGKPITSPIGTIMHFVAPSQEIGNRDFTVVNGQTFYVKFTAEVVNSLTPLSQSIFPVGSIVKGMNTFDHVEGRTDQFVVLWVDLGSLLGNPTLNDVFAPFLNEGVEMTEIHFNP